MKKIECFIRETDADVLVDALAKSGIGGVTLYPVRGFGRQRGHRGEGALMPKVKVEIFTLDIETEKVVSKILAVTRKGSIGDGKIAVLPVDDIIRIRTGEKGAKAVF